MAAHAEDDIFNISISHTLHDSLTYASNIDVCLVMGTPPFIFHLSWIWSWLLQVKQGNSGHLLSQQHFPAPPGRFQGVPRPDEIYNPTSKFWVSPGSLDEPRKPSKGDFQEANQIPKPPRLAHFDVASKCAALHRAHTG